MSTGDAIFQWLERMHTLHCAVKVIYVVDGYEVCITWNGAPVHTFYAETLKEAYIRAMEAFPDPLRR